MSQFFSRIQDLAGPPPDKERKHGELKLGFLVSDGEVTRRYVSLSQSTRTEHIAILGKTGTGKSSLLKSLCQQDILARRGFVYFDLHGDATPFLLRVVAREERQSEEDLSKRLIVIEPGDLNCSVGLNILERRSSPFAQIVDFVEILKERWHLASFGSRTEELLRNVLFALSESGHTLVEIAPFLLNVEFRNSCLARVSNADVKQYFEWRFNELSEGMQAVAREPILNKTSVFTADPRFRHILGQRKSTFSLRDAMDRGQWIIVNLDRGRLGEEALTFGSLFLAMLKNTLFARRSRDVFTLYCDEIQTLVFGENSLETMLSQSRKFGVSVTSANQFLDQFPHRIRSAILAVGTQIFFQLSVGDAQLIAAALDGGRSLAELLKNLPHRQVVVKTGSEEWKEVRIPGFYARRPTPLISRDVAVFAGRETVATLRAVSCIARPLFFVIAMKSSKSTNKQGQLVVQDRDRRLLAELGTMRFIDREQTKIVAGFGSTTQVNARLLALSRTGLLDRIFVGTEAGGRKALYSLSRRGASLVNLTYRSSHKESDQLLTTNYFVSHQLALNQVYCAAKFQSPVPGMQFVKWTTFNRPLNNSKLIPDGYFEMHAVQEVVSAFVEVDLGSEHLLTWRKKARDYISYAISERFERDFHNRRFRVLVVRTSERRLEAIRSAVVKETEKIFWFSTLSLIDEKGIWSQIWRRPRGEEFHMLIQR